MQFYALMDNGSKPQSFSGGCFIIDNFLTFSDCRRVFLWTCATVAGKVRNTKKSHLPFYKSVFSSYHRFGKSLVLTYFCKNLFLSIDPDFFCILWWALVCRTHPSPYAQLHPWIKLRTVAASYVEITSQVTVFQRITEGVITAQMAQLFSMLVASNSKVTFFYNMR